MHINSYFTDRTPFIFLGCMYVTEADSQSFKENLIDTTDNTFDISVLMSKVYGFVPILSLVTESAIGFWALGGLIFVHSNVEDF